MYFCWYFLKFCQGIDSKLFPKRLCWSAVSVSEQNLSSVSVSVPRFLQCLSLLLIGLSSYGFETLSNLHWTHAPVMMILRPLKSVKVCSASSESSITCLQVHTESSHFRCLLLATDCSLNLRVCSLFRIYQLGLLSNQIWRMCKDELEVCLRYRRQPVQVVYTLWGCV